MKLAVITLCAFLASFLGCLQVLNLAGDYRIRAVFTSVAIAVSQLTILKVVPTIDHWSQGLGFVVGGLVGSQLSMLIRRPK